MNIEDNTTWPLEIMGTLYVSDFQDEGGEDQMFFGVIEKGDYEEVLIDGMGSQLDSAGLDDGDKVRARIKPSDVDEHYKVISISKHSR